MVSKKERELLGRKSFLELSDDLDRYEKNSKSIAKFKKVRRVLNGGVRDQAHLDELQKRLIVLNILTGRM